MCRIGSVAKQSGGSLNQRSEGAAFRGSLALGAVEKVVGKSDGGSPGHMSRHTIGEGIVVGCGEHDRLRWEPREGRGCCTLCMCACKTRSRTRPSPSMLIPAA